MQTADWLNLVRQEQWATLDDRWMTAVEDPAADHAPLLAVLEALVKAGQGQRAAALAWMWLSAIRERAGAHDVIELAKEIIVNSAGSDQLRLEVAEIYKQVYADRPGIEALIEASGLLGGKTPRRSLRTLDICLQAVPGACLMTRTDDRPAEVVEADLTRGSFTLRTRQGTIQLDADRLASDYNLADPNDFRVLTELHPERFAALLADDPAALVIGMLRSHGGRMDADDLKYALTPRHLSDDEWAKWWSRARTALKRHPNVRVEGRTPVTLIFDEAGSSLDDEIAARWKAARTAEERIATIDSYLRECRSRKAPVNKDMLAKWAASVATKMAAHADHPAEAMRSAVVIERLRQTGCVDASGPAPIERILATAADPAGVLREFAASDLIHLMLDAAQTALPDRWQDVFLRILPYAAPDVCDDLAKHLLAAGAREPLQAVIRQIPGQPFEYLQSIQWLWRGPQNLEGIEVPPKVELFGRMMTMLADLARRDDTPAETLKTARAGVRAALTIRKNAVFREMLAPLEPEMVQTIHRQVSRTPGLSSALVHDLKKIIHEMFPTLFERERLDPWEDPDVIYTTEQGRARAEGELNHIVNVKMPENARAIGAAAAHGDLSENSEYKFALEERDLLRARVAVIQNDLSRARVIEPYIIPQDRVGVGSRVKVRSTDGACEREMVFLGPWDADIEKHIYNYQAPMSRKLMGLRVGDTVQLDLDGTLREFRIESVAAVI